jgi:hypothetical protein
LRRSKIDYTNVRLLGGDTVKTTDMVKAAGQIQGIFATSPVLEAKEFVAGRPFLERYLEAFKVPPAYGGHYSYDSTYVLTAAMQAAKSVKPKDVTAALRRINGYAPVTGTMKWDEKGEQRYAAVGVYELRRGSCAWQLGTAHAFGPLVLAAGLFQIILVLIRADAPVEINHLPWFLAMYQMVCKALRLLYGIWTVEIGCIGRSGMLPRQ